MKKKNLRLLKNIRINVLKLTHKAKSFHNGISLSIVEILYTLYFKTLKI